MRKRFTFKMLTVVALAALLALAPDASWAQRRGSSAGGGRSGGDGSRVSGGGSSGGGGSAVPRGSGGGSGGGNSGGRTTASGGSGGDNSGGSTTRRRDSDGNATEGTAVPRPSGGNYGGGGGRRTTIIVPGYYGGWSPWGWGGFGLAGYYGGYWDPWYGGGGAPFYDASYATGALRLKVDPRDASVFVDGYYAGEVDQFDGVFQRLKLEPGPHRIELSADGFETLMFEVNVLPDRTTTFKGELSRIQ